MNDHTNIETQDPADQFEPAVPQLHVPFSLYVQGLWAARNLVFSIICAFFVLGVLYAVLSKPLYSVSAIIGPKEAVGSGSGGGLSGLALSAGLSLGSGGANTFDKFQRLLQSARLAKSLEKRHHVLTHLYEHDWDAEKQQWIRPSGPIASVKLAIKDAMGKPWQPPSTEDLAAKLAKIVQLGQAPGGAGGINALRSQIIQVRLPYTDREYGIQLLTWILQDADALAREDALADSKNRIAYVQGAIKKTTEVSLYNSLTQILLDQERILMMLQADGYYSMDMIDPPNSPLTPMGPSKSKIVMLALLFGAAVASGLVIFLVRRRVAEAALTGEEPLVEPFPSLITLIKSTAQRFFGRKRLPSPGS